MLVDRYWTMVMGAEFAAFAPLAFIQTRPPWALERKPELADPAIHRLASQMVQHLTIRVNTFPSGHAAGSLAVAFAVIGALPAAGLVLLAARGRHLRRLRGRALSLRGRCGRRRRRRAAALAGELIGR